VTATNAQGSSNALSFTVLEPIIITSISPSFWFSGAFTGMTITGSGFQSGATVWMSPIFMVRREPSLSNIVIESSTKVTCLATIPKWWEMILFPDYTGPPSFRAEVTNPDGGHGSGGTFDVCPNPCGEGASISIIGLGLMMGMMALAGSGKLRRLVRGRKS
jgi:hypothetical protein